MALFFTKSLPDLIRGLRANKRTEEAYVTQSLDECRKEVRSSDMDIKAQAVAKLTYVGLARLRVGIVPDGTGPKAPHAGIRYVLGFFSHRRSHVVGQICL